MTNSFSGTDVKLIDDFIIFFINISLASGAHWMHYIGQHMVPVRSGCWGKRKDDIFDTCYNNGGKGTMVL